MRLGIAAVTVVGLATPAVAQDGMRFVERTPPPKVPPPAVAPTMPAPPVAWWAVPGVNRHDAGGYVGGGKLLGNGIFRKGAYTAPGPVREGTFGYDYAGLAVRPGRVFLGPSPDPSAGGSFAQGYRAEGPYPPDVFALRPVRKAVVQKKEDTEKRRGGGEDK